MAPIVVSQGVRFQTASPLPLSHQPFGPKVGGRYGGSELLRGQSTKSQSRPFPGSPSASPTLRPAISRGEDAVRESNSGGRSFDDELAQRDFGEIASQIDPDGPRFEPLVRHARHQRPVHREAELGADGQPD